MKISKVSTYHSKQLVLDKKIKLNVSLDFQNTINYLHARIKGVEWSGALFYEVTKGNLLSFDVGNQESINEVEIDLKHFELCDIGSAAYTEYDITEEGLFNMYDKHNKLTDWELGYCHSHHSMATNPSGTDLSHLRDSTETNQWFLSVIVNHDMKWKALLATRKTMTIPAHKLPINTVDYSGNVIKTFKVIQESVETIVFETELDIVFEKPAGLEELVELCYAKKAEKIKLLPKYNKISSFNWENPAYIDNPKFGESNIKSSTKKSGKQTSIFKDNPLLDINQKLVSDYLSVLLDCELKDKATFNHSLRLFANLEPGEQEEEIDLAFDCVPEFFVGLNNKNVHDVRRAIKKNAYDLLPPPYCLGLSETIGKVFSRAAEIHILEEEGYSDIPDFKL